MISLPYPVSANRYWKNFNGKIVRSSIADAYKRAVKIAAAYAGFTRPLTSDVEVVIQYHPKTTKTGAANKTRLDIDNVIKVTLDALNGVAYLDDKQVVRLSVELVKPIKDGGLSVWVGQVQETQL